MPIKEIDKLPLSAKDLFNTFLEKVNEKVEDIDEATAIAWDLTKENYAKPCTSKSITMNFNPTAPSGNYIDVMLGVSTLDADDEILDFWNQHPMHPIAGDMEHMYLEKAKGVYDKEFGEYEGFVPTADRFYNKEDGSLWAKVEIPNHSYSAEFMRNWELGEYGVSIEYDYPEFGVKHEIDNGKIIKRITEGAITGFTFTKNPAIKQTKIKNEK
jgi:hypothetical protein